MTGFFFNPWLGPVVALAALVLSRSGWVSRDVVNLLTVLAITSAVGAYVRAGKSRKDAGEI
ncbi:MAG TPA: hypothetical protein GXX30_04620 [Firmicutes bacterium]|nr:hypothetical protein [Candidatus Fermentithermobacillaceae bacterium]